MVLLSIRAYAIQPFTYYWTINTSGDTATVDKWKNNNDSVLVWSNRISDTLNNAIPRWIDFSNGLNTFSKMNIDTITGIVDMDTINTKYINSEYFVIDTIQRIAIDTIYGQPALDSINSRLVVKKAFQTDTIRSGAKPNLVLIGDSLITIEGRLITKGITTFMDSITVFKGLRCSSTVYGNSLQSNTFNSTDGSNSFTLNSDYTVSYKPTLFSDSIRVTENINTLGSIHASDDVVAGDTLRANGINVDGGEIVNLKSTYIGTEANYDVITITDNNVTVVNTFNVQDTSRFVGRVRFVDDITCGNILNKTTGGYISSDSINAYKGVFSNGISTNGTDFMIYRDTVVIDTLVYNGSNLAIDTIKLERVGNSVTCEFSDIEATLSGTYTVGIKKIPYGYRPASYDNFYPAWVKDNNIQKAGQITVRNTGDVWLYTDGLYSGGTYTFSSGTGGLYRTSLTWITNNP